MAEAEKNYSPSILRRIRSNHGITCFIMLLQILQLSPYTTAQTGKASPPQSPVPGMYSYHPKFSSSMAIVMVVIVSAFFFLGCFSVYIRQCAERLVLGSLNPSPIGGVGRRSGVERGLDPEVIDTFPTFVYSAVKGLKIGKGSLECAVCLNEFEDNETLRLLPKCNHVFHPICIDGWLARHTTCPVCRANLVLKPDETSHDTIRIFDSDTEPDEPDRTQNADDSQNRVLLQAQSPDVTVRSLGELTNQNRPPRSRSTGFRITGIFPRSHSTGHSLVQPGENLERFTLRLPEEVRSKIINSPSLSRTRSYAAFQRVSSSRRGYRSASVGSGRGKNYFYYERFDREERSDQRGFSMTPPFFSRTSSVQSLKVGGGDQEVTATPKTLLKSVRSPLDRLFLGMDKNNNNVDDKSSERLRSDCPV